MASRTTKPAVSASYLNVIFEALATLGLTAQEAKLMRKYAGISELLMSSPSNFLSIQQYEKLILSAIKFSKDPALGIYIGKFFELGTHGELSYAALGMPTVWECLKLGEKFARLRAPILKVQLSFQDNDAVINFDTDVFTGDVYRFVIEGGVCAYDAMINLAFNNIAPTSTISVRYDNPFKGVLHEKKYQKRLNKNIYFLCDKNEIRLPRNSVEQKLHTANPMIAKELEIRINKLLLSLENSSLSNQVEQLISNTLAFMPSQNAIAKHLNISTRTLRRKLGEENQCFQNIANNTRKEHAINYLIYTNFTIEEIAYLLGFSSASHFSNSFKLWTGFSPKIFKENKKI